VVNVKITKSRGEKIACAEGTCSVAGQVVSSAELMFAIMNSDEVEY
jgi:UDP-3-O-[3-hydroxymyristoyl] N-acetylglucosamine deacetylase/3-hydroxyacyl-[acyl-carrier-protein] dehydratase